MKKLALTTVGVLDFCTMLYKFDNEELLNEAVLIAHDPIAYLVKHFEVQVHQLEFLRESGIDFIQFLGFNAAAAIMLRRPVNFIDMGIDPSVKDCGKRCVLISSKLTIHLSEGLTTSSGQLDIRL